MTIDPTGAQSRGQSDSSTREKVGFLSSPAAYPASVRDVEVKETHMSWVFLAGERVYKLKKPVKYPFLDFSTLEAREADCREEVRLNRRLAPDVYLGVVPLTLGADGRLALRGKGAPVDWLVALRRLPAEKMLDEAIAQGTVSQGLIGAVADLLARFYRAAEPAGVTPREYAAQFAREQEKNHSLLTDKRFELPQTALNAVLSGIEAAIADQPDLLTSRARDGRIVDGHGDLRPEHVCLSDPPVIIDCLEFNRSFRLVDPFDELAFLGMECERLGTRWIGEALIARCADLLGDRPPPRLLAFYTAYRACLRARLTLAHLIEPDSREPAKWLPLAASYLAIAERACLTLRPREARPASLPRGSAG
jgi:aminoglycoside phosphotransferase family enzyme